MAYTPYTRAALLPRAIKESMFGEPWASAPKPTRKNLKLMKATGKANRRSVRAKTSAFSTPRKQDGMGQPIMRPMDR